MTNLQLLLSIGVPSLLIVLSWIQRASRIARLEAVINRGFKDVDRRIESLCSALIALRDSIRRDMISLHERVAVVEAKHTS